MHRKGTKWSGNWVLLINILWVIKKAWKFCLYNYIHKTIFLNLREKYWNLGMLYRMVWNQIYLHIKIAPTFKIMDIIKYKHMIFFKNEYMNDSELESFLFVAILTKWHTQSWASSHWDNISAFDQFWKYCF